MVLFKNQSLLGLVIFVFSFTFLFIVLLTVFVCFTPSVQALGIAPGDMTFVFNGEDINYNLRIINDEAKSATYDVSLNGELVEYITLSKKSNNVFK